MKYLPLYYEWLKAGRIPCVEWRKSGFVSQGGLCSYFQDDELFKLFVPIAEDEKKYSENLINFYWAADSFKKKNEDDSSFSAMRQTIVLFLAAMNNEL